MTLSASVQQAETNARRTLARADYDRYLPLVRRIAMRFARKVPAHITVSDLVGYGWVGLIEAFQRSEPGMPEEQFEAYALYRVRGAMLDYLRSLDPGTRELRSSSRRVAGSIRTLTKTLGRPPEEEEIAKELDMSLEDYRALLGRVAKAGMARLELLDIDNHEVSSGDESVDEGVQKKQIASAVVSAIETLPERLQQVLSLYYQEECTLKEIGAVLGVGESRACQLHTEAVHRLRAAIGKE
jgi:RNA polymerase sigma factor for flagellar operon FliA